MTAVNVGDRHRSALRTIGFDGFAQVEEQATDAICRTFVTFNLAYPAAGLGVGLIGCPA